MTKVPGAFSTEFARNRSERRRWKLDDELMAAILYVLPDLPTVNDPGRAASVLDLGCGIGSVARELRRAGYRAIGVDGTPGIAAMSESYFEAPEEFVIEADLTQPLDRQLGAMAASYWSLFIEVGEHIPFRHMDALWNNISTASQKGAIISWATPGQRGRDHVNCRTPEWVAQAAFAKGLILHEKLTREARDIAGKGWDRKLLVFTRQGCLFDPTRDD